MKYEDLTKDDQRRVRNADNYKVGKAIYHTLADHKGIGLDEVFYVKKNNGKDYVRSQYGGPKAKFMVVYVDDDGFVFAKNINANGKLGKRITCLTTEFTNDYYELEPDPDYVNSIILDNEEGYDPLAAAKKLTSNKNKARRRNKKIELNISTPQEAYEYIKGLNLGDRIFDAKNNYGQDIIEWQVTDIKKWAPDQTPNTGYKWGQYAGALGKDDKSRAHNYHKFPEVIEVKLTPVGSLPANRKWEKDQVVIFDEFIHRWRTYYTKAPFTVDDV